MAMHATGAVVHVAALAGWGAFAAAATVGQR